MQSKDIDIGGANGYHDQGVIATLRVTRKDLRTRSYSDAKGVEVEVIEAAAWPTARAVKKAA